MFAIFFCDFLKKAYSVMLVLLLIDLFIPQIFVVFTKKFLKDKNTFYTSVSPSMSGSILFKSYVLWLVAQPLSVTPGTVARQAPLSMGILKAGILEWVAVPFSRGSSQPRD